MKRIPVTYNGTNTDNLYVSGWKNGKEVKLKVKDLGCHGGIVTQGLEYGKDEYNSYNDLIANSENLVENTIYTVIENGTTARYLFFEGRLVPLDSPENIVSGLIYGTEYQDFETLYNDKDNLEENIIYSVIDKGTIEQYILKDSKIIQISNGLNEITEGNSDNLNEVSDTPFISGGIIDYNMTELVDGDYRYKNHSELHTVISDMSSLVSGIQMFYGTSLTSFCGDLSSLKYGDNMFGKGCKLDEISIINIIDSIPDYSDTEESHNLTISYDAAIGEDTINNIDTEAKAKKWNITWIAAT